MAIPNMATITASLERSLQNCSLNHHHHQHSSGGGGGGEMADGSDYDTTPSLEFNSHVSLPYHWEQCLDLKTGEIYYINWRTGMKSKEDPRRMAEENGGGDDFYDEDDDVSSYDSEGSSTESSPYSREQWSGISNNNINQENCYYHQEKNDEENNVHHKSSANNNNVLVVAGCKGCFTYYMVPKQHEICPTCCGQLIHFDRSVRNDSC